VESITVSEGRKSVRTSSKVGRAQAVGMQATHANTAIGVRLRDIKGKERKATSVCSRRPRPQHATAVEHPTSAHRNAATHPDALGFYSPFHSEPSENPIKNESCVRLLLNVE